MFVLVQCYTIRQGERATRDKVCWRHILYREIEREREVEEEREEGKGGEGGMAGRIKKKREVEGER